MRDAEEASSIEVGGGTLSRHRPTGSLRGCLEGRIGSVRRKGVFICDRDLVIIHIHPCCGASSQQASSAFYADRRSSRDLHLSSQCTSSSAYFDFKGS